MGAFSFPSPSFLSANRLTLLKGGTIFHLVEVVVDGKAGINAPESGTTVKSIFESLRRAAASRRRAVVAYILDGGELSVLRLANLDEAAPGSVGLLGVRTGAP